MMLALLVKTYRRTNKLTLRDLAPKIGITHDTLFRFETGKNVAQKPLVKIILWSLK